MKKIFYRMNEELFCHNRKSLYEIALGIKKSFDFFERTSYTESMNMFHFSLALGG
jgi:hypothetical protein